MLLLVSRSLEYYISPSLQPCRPEDILRTVTEDVGEEDLDIMLDSRVDVMAQSHVLLELALGVDAGDDVVTVTRPGDRDLAPDLMKDPTPHTPHLHVLQAVADEDGRVVPDDRLV